MLGVVQDYARKFMLIITALIKPLLFVDDTKDINKIKDMRKAENRKNMACSI